jgi:hypothetical protein
LVEETEPESTDSLQNEARRFLWRIKCIMNYFPITNQDEKYFGEKNNTYFFFTNSLFSCYDFPLACIYKVCKLFWKNFFHIQLILNIININSQHSIVFFCMAKNNNIAVNMLQAITYKFLLTYTFKSWIFSLINTIMQHYEFRNFTVKPKLFSPFLRNK